MAQAAPKDGQETIFPHAMASLKEFVDHAKPELEFVLDNTLTKLNARVGEGYTKYGTHLKTFNGRDAVQDAWEEAADLIFYLEQAIMETPRERQHELFDIADLAREALLLLTEQRKKKEFGIGG